MNKLIEKIFGNSYGIKARLFPTVLTSIPLLFLQYFYLSPQFNEFLTHLSQIKFIGNITISAVILYFLSQLNRTIGKDVFEKWYFSDESKMPTTTLLLYSNKYYSDGYKDKIRDKIKKDFDLNLPKKNSTLSELEQRKRIVEAIGLVRRKVGSGTLLLQHNIEYGFMRNLIGGSVISFMVSLICLRVFYQDTDLLKWSIGFSIFYLTLIIFSKPLIKGKGVLYAKVLFQEYLEPPKRKK